MIPRSWIAGCLLFSLFIWALLSGMNLFYGELNQDEGWYLYAARMTAEGYAPYHDFAFTQGPVFTTFYSALYPVVEAHGLMGGRLLTGLFGLLAILLAGGLAFRLTTGPWNRVAGVLTVMLLCANVYHNYFSLVVKTYSLCALLLVSAALSWSAGQDRRCAGWLLVAGLLFALAAGIRLSVGIFLPVTGLYLLARHKDWRAGWLWFGVGGLLGLGIAFGPAFLRNPDNAWFWLVKYHLLREAEGGAATWMLRAGFISRFVQAYYMPVLLLCLLSIAGMLRSQNRWTVLQMPSGPLWVGALLLSLMHWLAPFPYEDYQVLVMPLLVALLASGACAVLGGQDSAPDSSRLMKGVLTATGVAVLLSAGSSPLNQAWFVRERDRIWWRIKDQPDLIVLRETGRWLRDQAGPDALLLTQDTYLAVESGLRVPRGMEMGPFSYYPDWTLTEATQRGVINRDRLSALLREGLAPWVALSGYGFSIASPDITELPPEDQVYWRALVREKYDPVKSWSHFGQAHTRLDIYRLRTDIQQGR